MKKIFILLCIILVSCNHQSHKENVDVTDNSLEEIKILTEGGVFVPPDSLYQGLPDFIKLETTDDCLIGNITNILFDDSLIFVVDKEQAKTVFVFDMKGKFINRIGKVGNGPGEYTHLSVSLNKDKNQVIIYDVAQLKVIKYDYNGNLLNDKRVPYYCFDYTELQSGKKIFKTRDHDQTRPKEYEGNVLIITDTDNKILFGGCCEFHSNKFSCFQYPDFFYFGDEIFFRPDWCDTLFVVTDEGIFPKYYINIFPDKAPNPAELDIYVDDYFQNYLNQHPHFSGDYGDFIELKDFTYINIALFGNEIIYSHSTKQVTMSNGFYNNTPVLASMFMDGHEPIARFGDNTIVGWIEPFKLVEVKDKFEKCPMTEEERLFIKKIYDGLQEEDNPVLLFYHLNTNL